MRKISHVTTVMDFAKHPYKPGFSTSSTAPVHGQLKLAFVMHKYPHPVIRLLGVALRPAKLAVFFLCVLIVLFTNQASASFILDDFDDGAFSDETPLEEYRIYEDSITEFFGQSELFGALSLSQNPGLEAILSYNKPGGYDYGSLNRFEFRDALFVSLDFPETELNAVLKADGITLATGQLFDINGFPILDEDGFPILEFSLAEELGVVELLSFHFSTNGTESFSFSSTALWGSNSIQAVPEPTSILLVSAAFACGAGCYRMRKRQEPTV